MPPQDIVSAIPPYPRLFCRNASFETSTFLLPIRYSHLFGILWKYQSGGAGDGTRTRDILLGRQKLYQLSYTRLFLVEDGGIEPPTQPCKGRVFPLALIPQIAGAGGGTRTRDIFLGKEVLYQLSYTRTVHPVFHIIAVIFQL